MRQKVKTKIRKNGRKEGGTYMKQGDKMIGKGRKGKEKVITFLQPCPIYTSLIIDMETITIEPLQNSNV